MIIQYFAQKHPYTCLFLSGVVLIAIARAIETQRFSTFLFYIGIGLVLTWIGLWNNSDKKES